MKGLINPGFSNQIFLENDPYISTSLVEIFASGNEKEWFLEYEFEPSIFHEYIAIIVKVNYVEKVINAPAKAFPIEVRVRYRIMKDHNFSVSELYPIVTYSTALLIERFHEAPPAQIKNHPIPDCPLLNEIYSQLEELANKINNTKG